MREESREGSCQGLRAEPAVEPEGGAAAITQHNRGDQHEMREFLVDDAVSYTGRLLLIEGHGP